MIWACGWFALAPFLGPQDLALYAALCVGTGLALGADLALPPSMQADAAPGDEDSTLVPITPCRLVDTRDPSQPAIGSGETQTFEAHGMRRRHAR